MTKTFRFYINFTMQINSNACPFFPNNVISILLVPRVEAGGYYNI